MHEPCYCPTQVVSMLLEECSYPEVENYLHQKDILLIPTGAVEQHSPYGLIGTDFMAAEAVARGAGKQLSILVAPTFNYGISPHHMAFAGSATLSPQTYISICCDLIRSFTSHGFRRLVFVNGHGGNSHAIQTAFQQAKMEDTPGILTMIPWYDATEVKRFNLRDFEGKEGRHATPSEISLTMHLAPHAFTTKMTEPEEYSPQTTYWPMTATEMKTTYPDGRMDSAPWLANQEAGKAILAAAVDALCKKIEKIMAMPLVDESRGQ